MLGDAGIFVAWKILFGLSVCDIRMDSSDRKEISHCDIARQKAVRPGFQAFVRKATVFTVPLTLSDKNCQRYATSAKRAQWLCLPIATLFADTAGVGKRQVVRRWQKMAWSRQCRDRLQEISGAVLRADHALGEVHFYTTCKVAGTSERVILHE
ncbi:hypothetical protein M2267_001638 [Ensifer sp. KUDG1]|uniref:hypothetical protein n=1 Tax=Ensifer sp. KUDG1 TaxID=3373919 RepID=UPI003D25995B